MDEIIFLICVVLLLMLLGVIGFFIALAANGKASDLQVRLAEVERLLRELQARGGIPTPETQPEIVSQKAEEAEEERLLRELQARGFAPPEPQPDQPEILPEHPAAASDEPERRDDDEEVSLPEAAFATRDIPAMSSKAPAMGLEEKLGTRWAVWIGGLALALGGIFVVRYSIERGWLGPEARIAFGALFAAALIGTGEWLRRKELSKAIVGIPSAHIPGIVTAAGTTSAFATVYAAYALYHFIGPAAAFILLGLVALATMMASALHGPALAALGLVAALIAPVLVSTGRNEFWPVVIYLVFVLGAAYGLARLRWWRWLALAGAAGALIWGFIFLAGQRGDIGPAIGHIAIQIVMAAAIFIVLPYRATRRHGPIDWIACLVLTLFACLATLIAVDPLTAAARIPLSGAIAFGLLYLAWRFAQAVPLIATALIVVFGTLLLWPYLAAVSNNPLQALTATPVERENLPAFLSFAIAGGIVLAAASYFKIGRDYADHWKKALWFIASSTAGPLALLVLCYWRVTAFDHSLPFAAVAAATALVFTIATARLRRLPSEGELDTPSLAVGAAASAAVAGVALGLTMVLDKGILTVALALTALGVALIAEKIALPVLRYLVAVLALVVLGRLIWNPMVVSGPVGDTPIFNWLLWGYGVPAFSFLVAARILERQGRDHVIRLIEGLGFVFATLLVYFEVNHLITDGFKQPGAMLAEAGLWATASFAFAILMTHLRQRGDKRFYDRAADVYRVLSLVGCFAALFVKNPYLTDHEVMGGLIFNELLPAYLLPGLLAGVLAWRSRGHTPLAITRATAAMALVLITAYILLQIRLAFHLHEGFEPGLLLSDLSAAAGTSEAEHWCYSLALLAIGLVLLAFGFLRDMLSARVAALVYLVIVTGKVFIFDLANLAGLIRGLSFIGLGLVLVAIGYAYQNSRFGRQRKPAGEEDAKVSET